MTRRSRRRLAVGRWLRSVGLLAASTFYLWYVLLEGR